MDGVADTPEKMDPDISAPSYNKANEMDRLINELTFYSKIDTNRIPYTFNKIHISDYFEDCVDELSVELESSGVSLTYFNYLEEDAVVIADAEQLKRVINNIVSNSLKYMDKPKGVINIRLRDVGDFIQIEIEDNGKASHKRIWQIFLNVFTARMLREILQKAEAVSDFRSSRRSWRITAVRSGLQVKRAQVQRCIWL